MSTSVVGCTSLGMLRSGSHSELWSSWHISACSDRQLVAAGCAGHWFPSQPSTGTARAPRGTRGAAAPGFGGREAGVGVSVGARVVVAVQWDGAAGGPAALVQGQSPPACLCAR